MAIDCDNLSLRATNLAQELDLLAIDYQTKRGTIFLTTISKKINYQELKVRGSWKFI